MNELTLYRRRRVKCDEKKPSCIRCLSANRICEGYGIVIDAPQHPMDDKLRIKLYPEQRNSSLIIQPKPMRSLKTIPFLNHSESATFERFRSEVAIEFSGVRSAGFWQNVVLPACYSEPAILHASMALANAGRRFQDARSKLDTVNEYNKAIQHLKTHVRADGSPSSLRIALIACMLFIALELTTERFEEAIIHLNEGRKMLRSSSLFNSEPDEARTLILAPKPESIEDELVGIFADLDLQYTYFGSERPRLSLSPHKRKQNDCPEAQYSMAFPDMFSSIQEANQYLILATNMCLQFVGWKIQPERHSLRNELHNLQRQSLCEGLECWKSIYDRFYLQVSPARKEQWTWKQQSEMMLIQYAWLSVLVPNSYSEVEETVFDRYLQEFTEITDRASNVLLEKEKTPGRFTLEFGLVPPLSWTVLRCRHPQIRRRALGLLEKAPREGLWDPKLVVWLSRELISLEEGIDQLDSTGGACCDEEDLGILVPLQQRISDTSVEFEDGEYPLLRMGFQRKIRDGDGRVIGLEEIVRRHPVPGQPMMHREETLPVGEPSYSERPVTWLSNL
jgi:hypothetical protein